MRAPVQCRLGRLDEKRQSLLSTLPCLCDISNKTRINASRAAKASAGPSPSRLWLAEREVVGGWLTVDSFWRACWRWRALCAWAGCPQLQPCQDGKTRPSWSVLWHMVVHQLHYSESCWWEFKVTDDLLASQTIALDSALATSMESFPYVHITTGESLTRSSSAIRSRTLRKKFRQKPSNSVGLVRARTPPCAKCNPHNSTVS